MANSVNPKIKNHRVTGNLTADPREVPRSSGAPMVVFEVAENHRRLDRETNQWVDAGVTYYDVAITKEGLGQNVLASMRQGNRVTVEGTYRSEPYVTAEGEVGLNHKLLANDISASLMFNQVRMGPSIAEVQQTAAMVAQANMQASQDAAAAGSETDFDAHI